MNDKLRKRTQKYSREQLEADLYKTYDLEATLITLLIGLVLFGLGFLLYFLIS